MLSKEIVKEKLKQKSPNDKIILSLWEQILDAYSEGGKVVVEDRIIKAKINESLQEIKKRNDEIRNIIDEL